jgi:penicillin-binding protein 1B
VRRWFPKWRKSGRRRRKKGKAAARFSRLRLGGGAAFLLLTFGTGFYLAQLYAQISALIAERQAALTSAIYSAPTPLRAGDDIQRLRLFDRLAHLSYTQNPKVDRPGEYFAEPGLVRIYLRAFRAGVDDYPARMVRLALDGTRIVTVADRYGVAIRDAALEPEVIGRLLPGAPAERVEVSLGELKPFFVKGLIATEDRWFYYHPGFDPIRIVEAAMADFRAGHLVEGASTLTQQLARTFLQNRARNFSRKLKELAVALVLEIRLSKNQILERYINDVPMGEYHGTPIVGLPLAARYFFNKDLSEVTPAEAATLIGMIRAPTLYDPRRHPELCRARRDTVLRTMLNAGVIDRSVYVAAIASPVKVAATPGLRRAPYFTDYVTDFVKSIPGLDGRLRGLKVYTTLDTEMQADAQDALENNLKRIERAHPGLRRRNRLQRLQSAMVALDPKTGAILAMVGGRNYAASQYNRVTTALRQPGSAFKPIVYLAALDPSRAPFHPALTLASILPDRPMSFNGWSPENFERTYHGQVTVAEALFDSLNVPTAYLGSRLGPPLMIRTAHEMGIHENLPHYLPIAIGAGDVTLLELTSAYAVFADLGVENTPWAVDSVMDANRHLIFRHAGDARRIVDPRVAYLMTGALREVLRHGTAASSARLGLDFPAAGKTGTSQDYHDAYFVGYTPSLVCGVWVGFDHPRSIGMTGAEAALPAWVKFMVEAAPGEPENFPIPAGITMATIDPSSGGLATASTARAITVPFLTGTAPTWYSTTGGGALAAGPTPGAPGATTPATQPNAPSANVAPPASSSILGAIGGFFEHLFGQ